MMPTFLHPALLAGGALVALPIAIHLLYRLRFRRIQWAAMDFLLESERQNRRRIFLEQLLLLALRSWLIALLVLLVARPVGQQSLAALFASGQRSLHVIVLDDSFSMEQKVGASTPFAAAVKSIGRLAALLAEQPGRHWMTLRRSSDPNSIVLSGEVNPSFLKRLADWSTAARCSEQADSVAAGIEKSIDDVDPNDDTRKYLHVMTDLRVRDWNEETRLPALLAQATAAGFAVRITDAGGTDGDNLVAESLSASRAIAASVPLPVRLTVRNDGRRSRLDVPVTMKLDNDRLSAPALERVLPGDTAALSIECTAHHSGPAGLTAELPEDDLKADNRRFLALDVPERIPVLIVDSDPKHQAGRLVSTALAPGGGVRTGFETTVRGPEAITAAGLAPFRVAFLLNVPSLEGPAREAVDSFLTRGGGLAVFLGDQVQLDRYNQWLFGSPTALFPWTLGPKTEPNRGRPGADLLPSRHPVFQVFAGERNPFVDTVRIGSFFRLVGQPPDPSKAEVILRFRDDSPLVLEARRGGGRQVVFLFAAGTEGSNWPTNPSFVVAMLELAWYLVPADSPAPRLVGEVITVRLPAGIYRPSARLVLPAATLGPDAEQKSEQQVITPDVEATEARFTFRAQRAGLYRLDLSRVDGSSDARLLAVNVDGREGALARLSRAKLDLKMGRVRYQLVPSDASDATTDSISEEPRASIIALFVLSLIAEQWLAYRLGYHPRGYAAS